MKLAHLVLIGIVVYLLYKYSMHMILTNSSVRNDTPSIFDSKTIASLPINNLPILLNLPSHYNIGVIEPIGG